MSKVVPLAGLSAVSMVNGSDIGDFGTHRIFAVVLTIFACFVPSVYHHPDRIISSNFKNIGNESYRVSLVLSITMCCPMILDMICRISVEKKLLLDFKSLLLPFGIFAPNVFILAFCMDPGNPALFYSLILFQVVVLQSVLLAVLMVQDSQLFTNTVVNFIFYSRLCSVWCMVIYIVVDNEILAAAYFAFMCLATIIFFRKLFLWVRKNAENLYNLLFHDKIEMYDKTESQICDLHNATIMAFLEVSNLGFFANPYNRTLNYSLMCYFQIVVVVLLTLLPGRMSRRHATMSLEALDAKRNFVQYVSHEARGPLQIASLGLELLLNDLNDIVDSPPESTGAIADKKWMQDRVLHTKEILHACSLATSTLNDMLTFDKIENGMLQMEAEVVPAISFFHNEFRAFAIHARMKNIHMDCDTDSRLHPSYRQMTLKIDKHKVSQAFRNFVSNALKFTPNNGTISLRIRVMTSYNRRDMRDSISALLLDDDASGSNHKSVSSSSIKLDSAGLSDVETGSCTFMQEKLYCRAEVRDTGPGISSKNLANLFQKYVQFDAGALQNGGGTGLGLYLTKSIIELNGGVVGATSEGVPGKGCIFYMDLPIDSLGSSEVSASNDNATDTTNGNVLSPALPVMVKANTADTKNLSLVSSEDDFHQKTNKNLEIILSKMPKSKRKYAPEDLNLSNVRSNCVIRVLIVDDSAVNRKVINRALGVINLCTVMCKDVENGQQAVDVIKNSSIVNVGGNKMPEPGEVLTESQIYFDIIFMDSNMPVMGGEEAVREIRKLNYEGLIYGVTGTASADSKIAFEEAGANGTFTKPVQLSVLKTCVEDYWKQLDV